MNTTLKFARTSMLAAPVALAAGMVSAGGMSEPVAAPAPVVVAPAPVAVGSDWTGFYAGAQLGYGVVEADALSDDGEDLTYGAHAGYLYDFGSWVLGGELDLDGTEISQDGIDVDTVTRAKLRLGYDAGDFLPYITGGVAQLRTSSDDDTFDGDDTGGFAGLGLEYRVSPTIRVGGEVLQHQFEDYNGSGEDIDARTIAARVSFQF
ncbi:outer membrane protein [Roseobacter sp. CCS2]|uniref:outer membrane protein n=1 Tax=Roseobacter sp. CCS2 TaxID=391593 RepID=UPI0000F3C3D7|nr:outer membrane beta-barrel protein [Roseobacter sp. CCS2]EBA11738.1 possible outer membrane protein [Roseobacter sp. CCS2]